MHPGKGLLSPALSGRVDGAIKSGQDLDEAGYSSPHLGVSTFRTRYGAYKYCMMLFGLTNGPVTFQRFVNEAFMDYLDGFLTDDLRHIGR
jgi:hypothetical protein